MGATDGDARDLGARPMHRRPGSPLEMWGGVEGTVNRVGDRYLDQVERSGHADRVDDLDRFAGLGLRVLRYPVLWERTAPDGLASADWSWPDERLGRLRQLGLRPIVGLVHHGSGPRDTSLLDPAFPERLAVYAGAVARRYPWVEDYTPVNEPVTTARFAALYGHWYPHRSDDLSFARALLIQCRAVVLAMRAIRAVNPAARLIQTDDLGKTHSTPALAYQADWENERRWLSFDLLTGTLTPDRPMWPWLRGVGIPEADLAWFLENPCPPDVVGINHYLSSERYLDERLDRYPAETPGGNGRHAYVDVLAARVLPDGPAGPEALLGEAWQRYGLPLAITEAHNGCTREEQLRWLDEVWRGAERARAAGVDVRAVTAWALLGSFDWDRMVTRDDGRYEPGVFDLRAPSPRPTALARMVRDLATTGRHGSPVLDVPGWWRHSDRLTYGPHDAAATCPVTLAGGHGPLGRDTAPLDAPHRAAAEPRRLLIVGDGGALGRAVVHACAVRHLAHRHIDRRPLDLADRSVADGLLAEHRPWTVVDLGPLDGIQGPWAGAPGCPPRTAAAMVVLAAASAAVGVPLVTLSSDRVFDGRAGRPYTEADRVAPGDPTAARLARAEERVLQTHPDALLVRTGPLFGGRAEQDIIATVLRTLASGVPIVLPGGDVASPTAVPDLAEAVLDLLIDGERGVWHLANPGAASWAETARRVAGLAGLDGRDLIRETVSTQGGDRNRALASGRGWPLPSLDDALTRRVAEALQDGEATPDGQDRELVSLEATRLAKGRRDRDERRRRASGD